MSKVLFTALFCVISLIILYPSAIASAVKDRFNMYKDLVHLKTDDGQDLTESLDENKEEIRPSYFYRVPALGMTSESRIKQLLPTDMGKRTINRFKNYMLEKDNQDEIFPKAGYGTVYDWYLPNRENVNQD